MTDTALPICNSCKKEREEKNLLPVQLVRIDSKIFGSPDELSTLWEPSRPLYKDHSIPLFLCKHCDSYELEAAERILSEEG